MKPTADKSVSTPFKAGTNLLLLVLVVVISLAPMFLLKNAEFAGADNKAGALITEIAPKYTPWFTPIWEPPSSEIASLFFSAQAALGAGIMGYFLGFWKGRKEKADERP